MNSFSAFDFNQVDFYLDPNYGLNTNVDLQPISFWVDRIRSLTFSEETASRQPRYIASEPSFNGLSAVEFQSSGRNLYAGVGNGFSLNGTIAFVYKLNVIGTYGLFLFNREQNVVLGSVNLGGTTAGLTGVGIYGGGGAGTTPFLVSTVEDTMPHICVITRTNIIVDGAVVATGSYTAGSIMNNISYFTSASIQAKIGLIMTLRNSLNELDAIRLCDNINQEYAIY
jgi:hypothetical protein